MKSSINRRSRPALPMPMTKRYPVKKGLDIVLPASLDADTVKLRIDRYVAKLNEKHFTFNPKAC